uniref:OTU domain-containing protein n=3 Tax=Nucleocytoviricota sp. TaxID=2809609 RepID=A0A9E8G404_9VIRU|nr:hypothetical protein [Nucleocytoviricota sp.]
MVLSKLDKSINYKELKKLNDDDVDFETKVYSGELFNKYIEFTVGKPKYFYIEQNIIFFYIYLVNKNSVVLNIGVFEIESSEYPNIIDENGNILFDKLHKSLIFDFVENYIEKNYSISRLQEDKDLEKLEKEDNTKKSENKSKVLLDTEIDKLKVTKNIDETIKLKEETKEISHEEKRIYVKAKDNYWVEDFFKNNNYSVKNNEAGGDCLFATIRDGLEGTEKKISVKELREKLSQEVNKDVYESYKEKYEMFSNQYAISQQKLKDFAKRHKELKELLKTTKLKEDQLKIVKESKNINLEFSEEKENNGLIKSLYDEFKYMKNINSVEEFKEYIKKDSTCNDIFWADSWAISTLERIINIKLIILSHENYKNGDINNVLQCGQLNDNILESEGKFEPLYYLILDYTGDHYKLVLYKKHNNFQFNEIPYDIRELVVTKCLERQSGPFYLIPEFKNFAKRFNVDEKLLVKDIDISEPSQLYDSDIIFQFYIKSNGKPKPGKGNGEKIPDDKIKEFSKLSKIENWRRKLSNLWDDNVIIIGGKQWKSVEHFYQANKFKKNNPEYFEQFSLDSDSELSKDPILAKAAGSKTGKASGKQIIPLNIQIDPDFSKKKDLIMEEALYAKFTQSDELKDLIINTKNAKLLNYQVGDKSIIADDLMKVRTKIIT